MKPVNKLLLTALGTTLSSLYLNAATVSYDHSLADVGIVDNNNNITTASLTGSTGALVVTVDQSGQSAAVGIAGTVDIDTIKGTSLVSTDTVTMTVTVTSTTGNIVANGIEFGMTPVAALGSVSADISDFRPASNLILQIDDNGAASGMAIGNIPGEGVNDAGWGIAESSLSDGFTIELVANSAGYTFTVSDIIQSGASTLTTLSHSGTFSGSQFVDNFGGGHLYFTRQLANTNSGVTNFEQVNITVDSIPEPSTTALFGLAGLTALMRRRR